VLRLVRILRSRGRGEEGIALAVVVGISAVLLVVIMTGLTFSISATVKAGSDSDSNAALAAAYAGVSDYQSRLTNDNTYVKYGDPTAPFSASTASTTLSLPTPANPAFGYGATGPKATWQPVNVPDSTGNTAFRYEVDNSAYASNGVIRLLATGRSGNVTRSVLANLHQKGFLDFLYFTNYETQDPAITGKSQSSCTQYYPARPDSSCGGAIQFSSSEVLDGPVDSNDAMLICGGDFKQTVTTNYVPASGTKYYRTDSCSASNPTFEKGAPVHGPVLQAPPTNSAMQHETRADLTTVDVPRPGCLYTGPTSIKFNGDGTMTVRSPWTIYTNTGINTSTGNPYGMTNPTINCGTPGTGTGQLGSLAGQTIPVPTQNLIFVQSVPVVTVINAASDPNAWLTNDYPKGPNSACPSNGNDLGYPINTTVTTGSKTVKTVESFPNNSSGSYGCKYGDVFVQGVLKGQLTIASDHYVWVTGDTTYSNDATDILGLVGQNAVWVWNPYGTVTTTGVSGCGGSGCVTTDTLLNDSLTGRSIDAAVMSVQHTFQVQNFDQGSLRGTLYVHGAIAQQYRGTVGTVGATGYSKNYSYDVRFRNIAPPKFLQAVSTTYGVSQYADVPAAFKANGASN
jgi:hypothetical protein